MKVTFWPMFSRVGVTVLVSERSARSSPKLKPVALVPPGSGIALIASFAIEPPALPAVVFVAVLA